MVQQIITLQSGVIYSFVLLIKHTDKTKKGKEQMYNFNGFVESGALSGSGPTTLILKNSYSGTERRFIELDSDMRNEVIRHLAEFRSEDELEHFITHLKKGGVNNP